VYVCLLNVDVIVNLFTIVGVIVHMCLFCVKKLKKGILNDTKMV